jgi:metacaspase-1
MARGLSIHIGLNNVDPNSYQGWDGQLRACEADAHSMREIAQSRGFTPKAILTKEATAERVLGEIRDASKNLKTGDILMLTYSGHGGWVPDPEQAGKRVDTWVLYDRMVISHELYRLWGHFEPGVRIFVTSDSCHSGTVIRNMLARFYSEFARSAVSTRDFGASATERGDEGAEAIKKAVVGDDFFERGMPAEVHEKLLVSNQTFYQQLIKDNPASLRDAIGATVLLISGCQDNQTSADGLRNGLFTAALLLVWDNGRFRGDYPDFCDTIMHHMPDIQVPNYFKVGAPNEAFERQTPFQV